MGLNLLINKRLMLSMIAQNIQKNLYKHSHNEAEFCVDSSKQTERLMDMWIFFSEKSDRATVRLAEGLPAWLKPLPAHSTPTVLAYEWYCIVRTLTIPAMLNGFNHWFRFSYTVLLENDSLPLLWTPWFPRLTCLEVAVEMSCCPSHGQDPTSTLKG